MKTIIFTLTILASSLSFATVGDNPLVLDAFTKMKIIEALIKTPKAQNEYIGEASIADVMERDVRLWLSNKLGEDKSISLNCEMAGESTNTMYCSLNSYDEDESGESALIIDAQIYIAPVSTEINVSDVRAFIAG